MESVVATQPSFVITVGFVGTQTPAGTGIHGPGVRTPHASAVSVAVIGFNKLLQTPNGVILTKGMQSGMLPIGPGLHITIEDGRNVSGVGATPNGH